MPNEMPKYIPSRDRLRAMVDEHVDRYEGVLPFPHVVIDQFLPEWVARAVEREFPSPRKNIWIQYKNANERKLECHFHEMEDGIFKDLFNELNSPTFLHFLCQLTKIPDLRADPSLFGGGFHLIERGGKLAVHKDFNMHKNLYRRVNLLIYFNSDWKDEYNGHLELWSESLKKCVRKISPQLNRAVIFSTSETSFHGHPEPLLCPDDRTRKSMALYYYSETPPQNGSKTYHNTVWLNSKPPISVVVPIFNAHDSVQKLIESLSATYSDIQKNIHFYFTDDGSTDERLRELYKHRFFLRPDVTLSYNTKNVGFVQTINRAIKEIPHNSDLVLLNSDTEIWSDVFSILQDEAYLEPNIATVTPITNNGTTASLFNYPDGSSKIDFQPKFISQTIEALKLVTPFVGAPTGVGFCLFIKENALKSVGSFSVEFGRGYGEECDWCQRAIKRGWVHVITPKAFVYHSGCQSFGETDKDNLLKNHHDLLTSMHPRYLEDVKNYIKEDPLKFYRLRIFLELLKPTEPLKKVILYLVHKDPLGKTIGGTELHVRELTQQMGRLGHSIIVLFPLSNQMFKIRGYLGPSKVLVETFHLNNLTHVLSLLECFVDVFHIHQLDFWPNEILNRISSFESPMKLLTIHDLYFLCPSTFLINQEGDFCNIESSKEKCSLCLSKHHQYKKYDIEQYRKKTFQVLKSVDLILFPSESIPSYFEKAFHHSWSETKEKIRILPHDLAHLKFEGGLKNNHGSPFIVFLGAFSERKGAGLLSKVIPMLKELGFRVEIWGQVQEKYRKYLKRIAIQPYTTTVKLNEYFKGDPPKYVVLPSIWPETFSYTFFETLLLVDGSIPIVGPFGHPASLVNEFQCGIVLPDCTEESIIKGVVDAESRYETLLRGRKKLLENLNKHDFIATYLSFIGHSKNNKEIDAFDLESLRVMESVSLAFETSNKQREIYQYKYHSKYFMGAQIYKKCKSIARKARNKIRSQWIHPS